MGYLNVEQLQAIAQATASYVNNIVNGNGALTSYAKLNHNNIGSLTTSGNITSQLGNLECGGAILAADSENIGSAINGYLTIGSTERQNTYNLLVDGISQFTDDATHTGNLIMHQSDTSINFTPSIVFQSGTNADSYCDYRIGVAGGSLMFTALYNTSEAPALTISYTTGTISTSWKINAAAGFFETSDERKKNFAESIDIDFDKLKALKKNYFTWKDSDNTDRQIGVSAQEIRELYPELVSEDNEGMLSVAYDKLSVIALKAVDKLYDKNVELENRIAELERKFDAILSRIN